MIFIINDGEYKSRFQMVFVIVFNLEGLLPAGLILLSTHNVVDEEMFFSVLLFCFFNLILWLMKFVLRVESFLCYFLEVYSAFIFLSPATFFFPEIF